MTLVGFDSAWADNPRQPGAICAIRVEGAALAGVVPPTLVDFTRAATLIQSWQAGGPVVVAIDQPTIVANPTGARPVDRVAASVISHAGGGVQPASRARLGLFDDAAPIWRFFARIGARHDPDAARAMPVGCQVIEVFPALALLSLDASFFGRRAAPRYNPTRPTFRQDDWARVIAATCREAARWSCPDLTSWLSAFAPEARPRKADQDRLDCILCLLVALRWRLAARTDSVLIGDTSTGFIVAPVTPPVRDRLAAAAAKVGSAIA